MAFLSMSPITSVCTVPVAVGAGIATKGPNSAPQPPKSLPNQPKSRPQGRRDQPTNRPDQQHRYQAQAKPANRPSQPSLPAGWGNFQEVINKDDRAAYEKRLAANKVVGGGRVKITQTHKQILPSSSKKVVVTEVLE